MNTTETLESLIRRYVILGKKSPKGYEVVKCASCNDYKTRGGFKFEGNSVHYQCFNCSTSTGYDPILTPYSIGDKFKDILLAFGIPEAEIDTVISYNFFKPKSEQVKVEKPKRTGLELPSTEHPLPHRSVKVTSDESPWCEVAKHYILSRSLKLTDFDFYVSDETAYAGRLLIPYIFRDKVIYWQGRSMDDDIISPRYKNPSVEKENIFFNMDELYRFTDEPLFVVEGPLDAISIGKNAIALAGSALTEFKQKELLKIATRRRVIFVIDKNLPGYKLGNQILKDGQDKEVYVTCFPDNIEDANDALQKLGRLWMASHLSSTASKGFAGRLLLELHCSKT